VTTSLAENGRPRGDRAIAVTQPLVAVAVAGTAITALISFLPSLSFAYRSPSAHVAVETAAFLIAAIAATLVGGRGLRDGSRSELLLAAALTTLSLTNLLFGLIPALAAGPSDFATWAGIGGRLLGSVLFASAAIAPERRLRDPRRATRIGAGAILAALATIAAIGGVLAVELDRVLDPELSPETGNGPRISGDWIVLLVQALQVVLYLAATAGFAARARRTGEGLMRGFAVAALLSAFARLNYFLFPSLYSAWMYTGDLFRLASFLTILYVIAIELLAYQRQAASVAMVDERRRVARELHDGLAQELAYIRGEASRIGTSPDPHAKIPGLISAVDRALGEARAAIAALNRDVDESLCEELRQTAELVAARAGARVTVDGDDRRGPDGELRHALVRIVREATTNAVRHGGAEEVALRVDYGPPLRVVIADDGRGFDTNGGVRDDAFGLVSMRDRAEGVGGTMQVTSRPGEGTRIEVLVP
jgi:signal transduction histidine kinase